MRQILLHLVIYLSVGCFFFRCRFFFESCFIFIYSILFVTREFRGSGCFYVLFTVFFLNMTFFLLKSSIISSNHNGKPVLLCIPLNFLFSFSGFCWCFYFLFCIIIISCEDCMHHVLIEDKRLKFQKNEL